MDLQNPPEIETRLKTAFIVINVLLGCFFVTVLVLGALPKLGLIEIAGGTPKSTPPLNTILIIVAMLCVLAGFVARKIILNLPKKENQSDPLSAAIQLFLMSNLISFIIFEVIALLGFVIFINSGDSNTALILTAISLGCMIKARPKREHLQKIIES